MDGLSKSYYLKPVKIIRDSVHGYINLTKFDLELIDTVPFQRLSDVRQLTCQHVYPGARHTRFEHSLGVLELMRSSIRHLNKNRFLGESAPTEAEDQEKRKEPLVSPALEFNASVAALLHDVGHCPFSHMGETQFDKEVVRQALVDSVLAYTELGQDSALVKTLIEEKKPGAVHEQLSCIVILRKYRDILRNLTHKAKDRSDSCRIEVDFELIIRSILGLAYPMKTLEEVRDNQLKNVIVHLLNSSIFDVDKLDYIMRDSYLTGIGTPSVDTQRLFRNMYLDDQYTLVFTSKATPALQNMIEARDGLYMYVYNHHAVVYSDFLNTYISRRLTHNTEAFLRAVYPDMCDADREAKLETALEAEEAGKAEEAELNVAQMFKIGLVPKSYLFSVDAVVEKNYSDSAWLSLLNIIHITYNDLLKHAGEEKNAAKRETKAKSALKSRIQDIYHSLDGQFPQNDLVDKIFGAMKLVHQYLSRYYLKPWWKTVFEFSNFMSHNFKDDRVRKLAGKYLCDGGDYGLEADEMRSQIAKHVVYITKRINMKPELKGLGLYEPLNEGDFFVVQRSTNFFSKDTIAGLEIALKNNEILGTPTDVNRRVSEYYLKTLTNIVPQREYEAIYDKQGFYVFSKQPYTMDTRLVEDPDDARKKLERHYKLLEEIFVFVVKYLIDEGEQKFVATFKANSSKETDEERKDAMFQNFLNAVK